MSGAIQGETDMTSSHLFGAAALGLVIIAAPGYGSRLAPAAHAAEPDHHDDAAATTSCSLTRLKGAYGFTTTGSIVAAGPVGLVADVGVMTFDGAGAITETESLSLNGTPAERVS